MPEKQTILLVEPEEPFVQITKKALEPLDCKIITASDGLQAISLVESFRPDLIMLEAHLPGIGGIETCKRFQEDDDLRRIPVIFLSSDHDFKLRVDCLNAGAVDYVMKPFLLAELQARVRTHLRSQAMHSQMLACFKQIKEEEKTKSIQVFASGIGHNFNNLLTAGMGFLALAQDDIEDREMLGYLRNIELAFQRMCTLARQLLSFTGEVELKKRPVKLKRILTNALSIFDHAALSSGVTLVCDMGHIVEETLMCDEFALTQALLHLLNNARETTNAGGRIFFKAYCMRNEAVIEVIDFGGGMTSEMINQIRDPFYSTKQDVGHGLGLAMVDGVLRDLGGKLEIKSTIGEGTTVTLRAPLCVNQSEALDVLSGEFASGARILVAVDAEETRASLQAVLISQRFYVDTVDSFTALIKTLQAHPERYSGVILDLLRCELIGDDLVARIREIISSPLIYLVSSATEVPGESASLQILRKPFTTDELLGALRKFPSLVRYKQA